MFLKKVMLLLIFFMNAVHADVYKCEGEGGVITFQDSVCAEGSLETIDLPPPAAEIEHQPDMHDIDHNESSNKSKDRELEKTELARLKQQQRCQYYKDRLISAEEKWATVKRHGYKQYEKDKHLQLIRDRERDVRRLCG